MGREKKAFGGVNHRRGDSKVVLGGHSHPKPRVGPVQDGRSNAMAQDRVAKANQGNMARGRESMCLVRLEVVGAEFGPREARPQYGEVFAPRRGGGDGSAAPSEKRSQGNAGD